MEQEIVIKSFERQGEKVSTCQGALAGKELDEDGSF